ncbi:MULTISPECIES: NAD-dependent epimerase/dehydratase family protein [unclassified Fibrobacter]|uniref:NAD-dependent epimerase/dehydratase family protein n=1 Tax=unclassified Fibrobacter TaxID=2634177 RepID=UPI001E3D72CC|nr:MULTISPECIES: NAD-dependent epimerase/dehydratase family protein [unclassified Fibrobacter]
MKPILKFDDPAITVAVVGCGGFIGCHLLQAMLERTNWRVFGVDLESYRIQQHLSNPRFEFLCADLANPSVIQRVAAYPVVINLAAICTPSRYMDEAAEVIRSNYDHPARLADACRKSGSWLLHFSTSEIYGKTSADSNLLKEDSSDLTFGAVTASRWSYATAKLLTERYIAGLEGLCWTVVRPFNFVGPYMDYMPGVDGEGIPRVLANFSSALVRGEPLALVNGGAAKRSFTSVHDAVEFLFALFTASPENCVGQAFNVGNPDNELSIAELAQKMRGIYAGIRGVDVSSIPEPQEISGEEYYGAGYEDSMRRLPDVSKAERLVGFRARTPLDVVLRESLEWFVNHYSLECNG